MIFLENGCLAVPLVANRCIELDTNNFWSEQCLLENVNNEYYRSSGCGTFGRAVASNARDPRFESQHGQNFIC